MISETIIRLGADNLVSVEGKNEDGSLAIKEMTFDELISILKSCKSDSKTEKHYDTGILPCNIGSGVYTIATRIYDNDKRVVVMYRRPQPTRITYYDTVFEQAHTPGLIFAVHLVGRQFRSLRICAVKDEFLTASSEVYYYPFSNVSAGEYRVCFGRNNIFDIPYASVTDLHSIPNMFLSMPNNDDSYGSNDSGLLHRKLLEAVDGKAFPVDWLRPIRFAKGGERQTLEYWIDLVS